MGVRCPCSRSNTHALNWAFGVPVENIVLNLLAGFSVVLGSALLGGLLPTLLMLLPGNKAQYYTVLETVRPVEEVETKAIVPVRDIYLEKTARIAIATPCVEQEWIVVEEQDVAAGQWIAFTGEVTEIPEIVNPEVTAVMAMIAELDLMIAQAEKVIALANEFDEACNEIAQPSLSVNVLASLQEYADSHSVSNHKSDCECFTCCPFGKPFSRIDVNSWKPVHPMELARVKRNTEALLQELQDMNPCTPERADAFYSHGVTDAQLQAYMDEDNDSQDWFDNQLYV